MILAVSPWTWVSRNLDEMWSRTVEHAWLTFLAVGIGFAISFALSLLAIRWRPAYTPITWIAGTIYAIPSLALFALLVPITGLTTLTVEIALVGYTVLILVRNIVAGVQGVPPEVKEAATGMGYTPASRLFKVELPLALPAMIAGLRIATVTTIGLVTVGAVIGQGGLGQFVLEGFRLFNSTEVLTGIVLSVLLSVLADFGLVRLQRVLMPWARRRNALALITESAP